MKLFCIGRNYAKHAEELNNKIPDEPLVFMKPPTALLKPKQQFFYPDFTSDLHHEIELVVKIGKNGKHIQPKFAFDYVNEVSVGIDFTARDIQQKLKEKGHSWEIAKAFDQSAPIGKFISAKEIEHWESIQIELRVNGKVKQSGNTSQLLFPIPYLIHYISTFFTLQTGDLIYTGTPSGVGPVSINDHLEGFLNNQKLLDLVVQ